MNAWLKIEALDFSFGAKVVFSKAEISLPERGIYLCAGASGAGKSTLGLLLSGHLKGQRGKIFLEGQEIEQPNRQTIYVSQEDDLFPWLKVGAQADFFSQFPGALKNYQPLLEKLRLQPALNLYPMELSGGMRKRLALLRTVILQPKLLILDEVFSSIDIELRESILQDFQSIWKMQKIGVILITHDISESMQRMANGRLELGANHMIRTTGF